MDDKPNNSHMRRHETLQDINFGRTCTFGYLQDALEHFEVSNSPIVKLSQLAWD